MSETYITLADLIEREITPALTIAEDPRETMMMAGIGPLFTDEAIKLAAEFETDDELDQLEAIREAQTAGEADYFERWAEKARAAALALGYRAEVVRAISGSPEAHRATKTPYGTLGRTVEEIVWQDAHDSTDLPEGWEE